MMDCNVEDRPTITTFRRIRMRQVLMKMKRTVVVPDNVVNHNHKHKHKHNYPCHVN